MIVVFSGIGKSFGHASTGDAKLASKISFLPYNQGVGSSSRRVRIKNPHPRERNAKSHRQKRKRPDREIVSKSSHFGERACSAERLHGSI